MGYIVELNQLKSKRSLPGFANQFVLKTTRTWFVFIETVCW